MKSCLLSAIIALTCLASCSKKDGPPPPSILSFYPQQGGAGIPVSITGLHFDTVLAHLTVKFNGVIANIDYAGDTVIGTSVPAGATTGKISVTVNGRTVTSTDDFIILPGKWIQKASLPNQPFVIGSLLGIGFAIGNYGYWGLGEDNGAVYNAFYQYDPVADTWSKKTPCPVGLFASVCMVINNKAYICTGQDPGFNFTTWLFEYDPSTDTWTRKADFPGAARSFAFGAVIGGKGYVGLGGGSNGILYDVWQYDPSTDSWTQKADFPHLTDGYVQYPNGFVLGDSVAYMAGSSLDITSNPFWQYKPSTDTWTRMKNIPGIGLLYPATMVIDGKAYLVGGGWGNLEYLPASDSWLPLAFFTARIGGSAFVIDGTGYFGMGGWYSHGVYSDLWQFQP